jgi:hypothetical protein
MMQRVAAVEASGAAGQGVKLVPVSPIPRQVDKSNLANPAEIAQVGHSVYEQQYKRKLEQEHAGEFAAINVNSGAVYVDPSPEDALEAGQAEAPDDDFYLIRIGAPGAFRVS